MPNRDLCHMHSAMESRTKRNEGDIDNLYSMAMKAQNRVTMIFGFGFGFSFLLSAITIYLQIK